MGETTAIRIPQEFVNDDVVKLVKWFVDEGHPVNAGQTIAELETSKAVVELAATTAGKIQQRVKAGEDVRVGEIVGYIVANGAVPASASATTATQHDERSSVLPEVSGGDTRFSKKAQELLDIHALSAVEFSSRGLVRERDVLDYLARRDKMTGSSLHFALNDISMDRVSLPFLFADVHRGKVEPEFLAQLRANPQSYANLSSVEKCEAYRNHGAVVEDDVIFGTNAYVIAPQIVIGKRVQLGAETSIECRERFLAGQLSSFRAGLSIRGGTVVLGENVYGGGEVQIGGGGHADPCAVLVIGDGAYIGDQVFINICRPVLIGKEVFLTQRSVLVTHNIGHSILEGYENRFAAIVLEDYAQIGMQSTIYAGVRIGCGSIVLSNSYVVSSLAPGKLAAGVPARVIREAKRPIDRERQVELVREMMGDYRNLLLRKGHEVSEMRSDPFLSFEVTHKGKRFELRFVEHPRDTDVCQETADETVIWNLEDSRPRANQKFVSMDLLSKKMLGTGDAFTASTREFLRKRGIRLEPGPWRYSGGLL